MIYIPTKYLRPGMVLAKDIPSSTFYFALIPRGYELTSDAIQKLSDHGITGVYIENSLCSGAAAEEFIEPGLKRNLLTNIQKTFRNFSSQNIISSSIYKNVFSMATDLVSYILSQDVYLINMIEIRDFDTYTYSHSLYVGLISSLIGIQLGFTKSALVDITISGLLHDIGKLDIPVEIINKPGKLNEDEFELIRAHPDNAVQRLSPNSAFSPYVLSGIACHHEKFDGTGYPRKLKGEKIPLFGRIMALADVYDALISKRPYRDSWTPGQAIEYMTSLSGTHFDSDLLQIMLNVVTAYPVGSAVRLSNGYVGVVTRNTPSQSLRPTIQVLQPAEVGDLEIDLAEDREYLNVTVVGTVEDYDVLIPSLMETHKHTVEFNLS